MYAKEEESKTNEPLLEHISKRQKFTPQRGGQHKGGFIWYIDYPHLLKVLQWRRYSVYQQLNPARGPVGRVLHVPHTRLHQLWTTLRTDGAADGGRYEGRRGRRLRV